jgi:hypothetical protein
MLSEKHIPKSDIKIMRDIINKDRLMMSKKSFTNVAVTLANGMYLQRCDDLEHIITQCFEEAFVTEKISRERMERIYTKFCDLLLGEEIAN